VGIDVTADARSTSYNNTDKSADADEPRNTANRTWAEERVYLAEVLFAQYSAQERSRLLELHEEIFKRSVLRRHEIDREVAEYYEVTTRKPEKPQKKTFEQWLQLLTFNLI